MKHSPREIVKYEPKMKTTNLWFSFHFPEDHLVHPGEAGRNRPGWENIASVGRIFTHYISTISYVQNNIEIKKNKS